MLITKDNDKLFGELFMPGLEIWVVYNRFTQHIDVVKSKRYAVRIATTYNKLFDLINSKESVICLTAEEFFSCHHYDKEKIRFCWDINLERKSDLIRTFFNYKNKRKLNEKVSV